MLSGGALVLSWNVRWTFRGLKASLMTHYVKAKLYMPSVVDWKAVK